MRGLRAISDMQAKRPTLGQLQRLGADPVSAVFLFSCRDRHSELVFLGWQGTGGEGGERAGRILRLVEIEDYFAVGRRGRVQKARCRIGLVTAGQVGNDEEEKPVGILLNREQLIRVTVTLKRRLAQNECRRDTPQDVPDRNFPRLFKRNPVRLNPPRRVDREIVETEK